MIRRIVAAGAALLFALSFAPSIPHAEAVQPINFTRGTLAGAGFATTNPSTLAFGPDGRLYIANTNGRIQALTLDPVTKAVTAVQQITTDTDLQEVFGIAFDPNDASSPPPIYITNTISGFGDAGQAPPGSYPGKITKISGAGYATRTDIITGLPASNSGHEANGLAFGPDGRLYILQGSTTNAGLVNPNPGLFQRPESPLSGAVLVADIHAPGFNGNITYSPVNTYSDTVDKVSGDVTVYAPGFRNPYDLVFHSNGRFYLTDNGPNPGYGPGSLDCTAAFAFDAAALDSLELVVPGNYYGHANRNRGRTDARQCTYHANDEPASAGYTAPIEANLPASSDGLAEYTSAVFGGQMQGDLLYAAWVDSALHRVKLSPDGATVISDTTLATGLTNALDVTVGSDGTIYVAEYGGSKVTYFKPDESPVSGITVSSIFPAGGPVSGGQQVTVTGTNFTTTADTVATIGGAPITNLVVENSTTLKGTSPAGSVGAADVVVTNSVGTATLAGGYTYSAGGGTIPPVAAAGPDIVTPIAHENHAHVTLDGRGSTDADGFIVSYVWTENGAVLSSNVVDSVQLTLGTHLLTLTVTDNDNLIGTDELRVTVTATALNPDPFYCFDVDGDGDVDTGDVQLVASAYGKRFGEAGYTRLRDWNADRVINSVDVMGTLQDITASCPLVDRQIRAATVAMEPYQNINTAIAAGYGQITPYIEGQGRHMSKGGLAGLGSFDAVFNPSDPESLLYEPDASTPGGWRLGGAMFIVPVTLTSIPPDGFDGGDDAWHYHSALCIWNAGNSVEEDVPQADCQARSQAIWIEKAGWLLHLWNYHLNPTGRFVEINNQLRAAPKASTASVAIDANPGTAGVQTQRSLAGGTFTVDVVASGVQDVGAFNFDVQYDAAVLTAPTISGPDSRDLNPDANQAYLQSTGRTFTCTPPAPATGIAAGALKTARIACTSTGTVRGPDAATPQVIASVRFSTTGSSSTSPLKLANVNLFDDTGANELASCNPTVSIITACADANVFIGADADGDGMLDSYEAAHACLNAGVADGASDADADVLSNLQEMNTGTDPCRSDTDADACGDGHELQLVPPTDPLNAWDFYSVPVPALIAAGNPLGIAKDSAVSASDAQAVFAYFKALAATGTTAYEQDLNANGVKDGFEYDRSPAAGNRAGPPAGALSARDAQMAFAQFTLGYTC
jgi:glucose/arabinose dehydrogenase